MTVNAAQLMVTVGANTAAAEQGITGFARLLGPGGILGLGAIGAAAAVAGIGIASVKMAGDFQTSLNTLVTGAGELPQNMALIHDGVLQMARDTGTSTKQLTDGLYMIESAGYHGQAGLDVLKAAAEGAKVGNADLGVTADAVTTVMTDYAKSGITAAEATNTLVATVSNGKTHLQDLSGALAAVLPTAQAAGVGLNDVMAAMAAQTAVGVPAADAATHLRQMLIALEAPSSQAKKALEDVGLSTDQVTAAMKLGLPDALQMITDAIGKKFPQAAQNAAQEMAKVKAGTETFDQAVKNLSGGGASQYMEALKNISGGSREMQGMLALTGDHMTAFKADVGLVSDAVQKGGNQITNWNVVQGSFNQKMAVLGETVKTLMISLGEKLLPVATQLADFLGKSLGPIVDDLTGKNSNLSKGLGGDLMKAAKSVSDLMKTDVQPIMKSLGDLWEHQIVPVLHTLADVFVKNILPAMKPVVKMILEKVIPPMVRIYKDILPVLNPLLQAFGWVFQNIIGPALSQVFGLLGGVLGLVADLSDAISNFFKKPEVKKFFDWLGNGANAVSKGVGGFFSQMPHFAEGGIMAQTGLALVGEQGPELVTLPGGAQVTPMASMSSSVSGLPAGAGGYGGGGPITIVVQTNLDGRRVAENQVKYLPSVVRNATGRRDI